MKATREKGGTMNTRTTIIALGLTLAACNQGAPPAAEAESPTAETVSPSAEQPDTAALLERTPLRGNWESVGDEATTGVRFTAADARDTLTIGCNNGSGEAFVTWTPPNPIAITNRIDERYPTQNGEVQITTAAGTVTFSGTGSNLDGHMVSLAEPGDDTRFAALKAQQDRFAVQAFGQTIVVPWSSSIADALSDCAG
jgi:hypothetical protein